MVIRRIINQLLISKLHAQITLHPITPSHASSLEPPKFMHIFLFLMPSSEILHLPISHHGFQFASISHFNDAAAVSSVIQDLNHHIPLFCNMAQITIADWQCSITKCIFPFSPEAMHFSYHLSCPSIPIFFTLAHCVLHSLKLNIVPSDQSSIMRGEISLIHLAWQVPNSPHMTMLRCYIGSPYQFLDIHGVPGILGDSLPLILSSSCLLLSTHSPLWGLGSHMVPRSRAVWPVCVSDAHLRYGRLGGHIVTRSRVVSPVCISDAHLRYWTR